MYKHISKDKKVKQNYWTNGTNGTNTNGTYTSMQGEVKEPLEPMELMELTVMQRWHIAVAQKGEVTTNGTNGN